MVNFIARKFSNRNTLHVRSGAVSRPVLEFGLALRQGRGNIDVGDGHLLSLLDLPHSADRDGCTLECLPEDVVEVTNPHGAVTTGVPASAL